MTARRRYASPGLVVLLGVLSVIGVDGAWADLAPVPPVTLTDIGPPPAATLSGIGPVSTATLSAAFPSPTPVGSPRRWDSSPPGVVSDAALVARLDPVLATVDGQVSIAVKDLGSGRGAVLDGDREMPAASLYKLPVLYAVFDAGLGLGEQLVITDDALAYDLGSMELGVGETLTVAEALERMVTISDNTSALMLASRVGGWRVNASIASMGMESTHFSLERLTTSALDMLRMLDLLARGKAVSAAASSDMLHLLLRQRVNDRLPRLLPEGFRVAHKTGNLPGTVNDVGIVYGPSRTIAVAALISETTDDSAAAASIARVALETVSYFEDQPDAPSRPEIPAPPPRPVPPVWRQPKPTATPTPDTASAPAPDDDQQQAPALSQR